jgi:hypothetical protein
MPVKAVTVDNFCVRCGCPLLVAYEKARISAERKAVGTSQIYRFQVESRSTEAICESRSLMSRKHSELVDHSGEKATIRLSFLLSHFLHPVIPVSRVLLFITQSWHDTSLSIFSSYHGF